VGKKGEVMSDGQSDAARQIQTAGYTAGLVERVRAFYAHSEIRRVWNDPDVIALCDHAEALARAVSELEEMVSNAEAERNEAIRTSHRKLEDSHARAADLERERDEALLLCEGPSTLRELAAHYLEAIARVAELDAANQSDREWFRRLRHLGRPDVAKVIERNRVRAALAAAIAKRVNHAKEREANARVAELEAELREWQDAAQVAVNEPCGDERHCACVPLLRRRVAELEADNSRLRDTISASPVIRERGDAEREVELERLRGKLREQAAIARIGGNSVEKELGGES
jgi:hypothetical protein